jgi:hypothetical protein
MHLNSYVCELCILQKEETIRHLFFSAVLLEIVGQKLELRFTQVLGLK